MRSLRLLPLSLVVLLAACDSTPPPAATYSLSVEVTGLTGTGLAVANGKGTPLTITANGRTAFSDRLASGAAYDVKVTTQPTGQTCSVENGTGTVGSADVVVKVACATGSHAIAAQVTGLQGSGLALTLNGGGAIAVEGDGRVVLAPAMASGLDYVVAVASQPESPWQTCTVSSGTGKVGETDVTVAVACTTNRYPITVTVSGLVAGGLELRNNGGDELAVAENGKVTFPTQVESGQGYAVTVRTQPATQTCLVERGTGTVAGAAITNVKVECGPKTWELTAKVEGLAGKGLTLVNGAGAPLAVKANGVVAFPARLADGESYLVTVSQQPTAAWQDCVVSDGAGTVAGADVQVRVSCTTRRFAVRAQVAGVLGSGLVLRNGADEVVVAGDGPVTVTSEVDSGAAYSVVVKTQPTTPWQTCAVESGAGTVGGADAVVQVTCTTNRYALSASVSGLSSTGLRLASGGDTVDVVADGEVQFPTRIASGAKYSVSVAAQPAAQHCLVNQGSGTITDADVSVGVLCMSLWPSVPPAITGRAKVFDTLTGTDGTWVGAPNPVLTRQWRRCDASGSACKDIVGATGATHVLGNDDFETTLRLRVTATAGSVTGTADSEPTPVVGEPACANPVTLGPLAPAVVQSALASQPWTNPEAAFADDGVEAVSGPLAAGDVTDTLELKGFGFAIPSSAKVKHIQIEVERRSAAGRLVDHLVQVETPESGTLNLARAGAWATTAEVVSYGGAGTSVGSNISATDVNSPDFKVLLAARSTGGAEETARIDRVTVKVTYLAASLAGPYTATALASVEDPAVTTAEAKWAPLDPTALAATGGGVVETGDFVANGKSEYLVATGFGVSLPTGAKPTGVVVELVRQATVFDWAMKTDLMSLVKGGTVVAGSYVEESNYEWVKEPAWQTSVFGSSASTWRTTLTAAEATDPGFGIGYRVRASIGSVVSGLHARLDHLRLFVAYDPVETESSRSPSVVAQERTGQAWGTPEGAAAPGGSEAVTQLWGVKVTDRLQAKGFGFSIPAQAWVRGVSFTVTRRTLQGWFLDEAVQLLGVSGADANRASKDPWPKTATPSAFGGSGDRWSPRPISPTEVSSAGFGLSLAAKYTMSGGNDIAYVDAITGTVTYCLP